MKRSKPSRFGTELSCRYMEYILKSNLFVFVQVLSASATCSLPPDFWCDHVNVTNECAGEQYCGAFRRDMKGRPFKFELFFDPLSNDTQVFVTEKMYPNYVIYEKVADFGLHPLFKDVNARQVQRHFQKDDIASKFVACVQRYIHGKPLYEALFCLENNLINNRSSYESVDSCLQQLTVWNLPDARKCMHSTIPEQIKEKDEQFRRQLQIKGDLTVQQMAINGKYFPEFQAYQSMLKSKFNMWNQAVNRRIISRSHPRSARCPFPPDFWCDDRKITRECFDSTKCRKFESARRNKVIELKILYASKCHFSQEAIVDVFYEKIWKNPHLKSLVHMKFLPFGNARIGQNGIITCQHGPGECEGNKIHDCVQALASYSDTVEFIACYMRTVRETRNIQKSFDDCAKQRNWTPKFTKSIKECAKSDRSYELQQKTAHESGNIWPEPKHFVPWLVMNDYSITELQSYLPALDKYICRWYYGSNHDRKRCNLCDYAPSRCPQHS
ncbi:hypothetical protein AB6A40_000838 [Gnathostoma spinigerum]|uniref:Uncharacterized protein n=1 Tax=Gnathostoma spinigerum TaxID=75299 RepID=A0ABD6E2U8_9BILA